MLKRLQSFYQIIKKRLLSTHHMISDGDAYSLPPKIHGRIHKRTNRDFLFDEISWMALDFHEERRLKVRLAAILAKDAAEFVSSRFNSPFLKIQELGTFCQQTISNDVLVFGPPDRKILDLPYIPELLQTSVDISTHLTQKSPEACNKFASGRHGLSLLEGPFSCSSSLSDLENDPPTTLNEFLLHHLENVVSSSRTSSHPIIPPWSLLEDQLVLEACLQFNFNCHINSALQQTASSKSLPFVIQHELMPPCNLVSELLNATCHHNSFVRTPFSVLQRFHYLVKLDGKNTQSSEKEIENKPEDCSRSFLLRIYRKALSAHKSQKLDKGANFSHTWKLKQWEKRLFIFGLIKKKIHTHGGSILTKDHKRQVNLASERKHSKLSTTSVSSVNQPTPQSFKSHLPYNLYVSAVSAHPSHESAIKKATSGIPKHLANTTFSASDLALKRLHRVYHFPGQQNIGPVIISPIGGGLSGTIPSGASLKKGTYPDQIPSPTQGSAPLVQSFQRVGAYSNLIPTQRSVSPTSNRGVAPMPNMQLPQRPQQVPFQSPALPLSSIGGMAWNPTFGMMTMGQSNWNSQILQPMQFPSIPQSSAPQVPGSFQQSSHLYQPMAQVLPSQLPSTYPSALGPFYPTQTPQPMGMSSAFGSVPLASQMQTLPNSMPLPPPQPSHLANVSQMPSFAQAQPGSSPQIQPSQGPTMQSLLVSPSIPSYSQPQPQLHHNIALQAPRAPCLPLQHATTSPIISGSARLSPVSVSAGTGSAPPSQNGNQAMHGLRAGTPGHPPAQAPPQLPTPSMMGVSRQHQGPSTTMASTLTIQKDPTITYPNISTQHQGNILTPQKATKALSQQNIGLGIGISDHLEQHQADESSHLFSSAALPP